MEKWGKMGLWKAESIRTEMVWCVIMMYGIMGSAWAIIFLMIHHVNPGTEAEEPHGQQDEEVNRGQSRYRG